jgi:hypothetical protein
VARASCFTEGVVRSDHPTGPPSFLHDGASHPPNIDLVVAAPDSRGDEWASIIDHEDGDDSLTTDGVALGVAAVVQSLDLGLTGIDLGLVFLFIFKN